MTYVVVGLISFMAGSVIGLLTAGLMTASKINSIYDEISELKRKELSKEVGATE